MPNVVLRALYSPGRVLTCWPLHKHVATACALQRISLASIRRMTGTAEPVALTAAPADGQLVEHDGALYTTKQEGLAFILIPPNTKTSLKPPGKTAQSKADDAAPLKPQNVFYNPIQQFNRDLSVLAIKAFGDDWIERKLSNDRKRSRNARRNEQKSKKRKLDAVGQDNDAATPSVKLRKSDDEDASLGDTKEPAEREPSDQSTEQSQNIPETTTVNGSIDAVASNVQPELQPAQSLNTNGADPTPKVPRLSILDALSASGLRALRYAKEIPTASSIVANDMSSNAIKSMKMNIQHNELTAKITPNIGDAIGHMYSVAYPPHGSHGPHSTNKRYDVIDLDPYGTAVPFLDASLQALSDGGLLCVTCTDSGVFNSCGYSEKTYALYGGMPVKGHHLHEGGLRLILHSIATTAAKHGLAIEPLLSLSIDYYARVFVRVIKSPADVKFLAGKTMLVYGCDIGCGAWTPQLLSRNVRQQGKNGGPDWFKYVIAQGPSSDRLCEHCESKMHVAGPMWAGPLHNQAFVQKLLLDAEMADPLVYGTKDRVEGMLTTVLEELTVNDEWTSLPDNQPGASRNGSVDDDPTSAEGATEKSSSALIPKLPAEVHDPHPFYFIPSALCKVVHCIAPPDAAIKGALRHAGYRAVRSHCQPGVVKTDAPWNVIWRIIREWVRQRSPIKEGALKKEQPGYRIMYGAAAQEEERMAGAEANHNTEETDAPAEQSANDAAATKRPKIVFDEDLGRDKPGKKLVRYQQKENWGPMARAKGD